jgi:hypothetical protein
MIRGAKALRKAGQDPLEYAHKCSLYVNDIRVVRTRYKLGCSSSVFKEAAEIFSRVTRAKLGEGTLRTLGVEEEMVGCWRVDLNYSFQTGALWMKQGKAVEESVVVLGITQNMEMVTDIFGETRVAGSFGDSIKGKETTLTAGILKKALAFSNEVSVPASCKIFPPIVDKEVALILARDYLNRISYNSGGKIRLSIPTVATLVFLPYDSRSGSVRAGPLSIRLSHDAQEYIQKNAL